MVRRTLLEWIGMTGVERRGRADMGIRPTEHGIDRQSPPYRRVRPIFYRNLARLKSGEARTWEGPWWTVLFNGLRLLLSAICIRCALSRKRRRRRGEKSLPGIEPGLQPSQGCVRFRHTPRTKHPVEESNPFLDVRSVACRASHSLGSSALEATGFAGGLQRGRALLDSSTGRAGGLHGRHPSKSGGGIRTAVNLFTKQAHRRSATPENLRCNRQRSADPPGFEPGASVLEADCSPRSTDL
jgi:hypothetical protein